MILVRSLFVAFSPLAWAGGVVNNTSVGFTPLDVLGTGTCLGQQGGLYPAGLNEMPATHRAAGATKAAMIQPLDSAGNPSPSGKIVMLTLGMSNANQVFSKLGKLMNGLWAPGVVLVNGAQGGIDAALWAEKRLLRVDFRTAFRKATLARLRQVSLSEVRTSVAKDAVDWVIGQDNPNDSPAVRPFS